MKAGFILKNWYATRKTRLGGKRANMKEFRRSNRSCPLENQSPSPMAGRKNRTLPLIAVTMYASAAESMGYGKKKYIMSWRANSLRKQATSVLTGHLVNALYRGGRTHNRREEEGDEPVARPPEGKVAQEDVLVELKLLEQQTGHG